MPQDRMMQAIGRIERALGRLEKVKTPLSSASLHNDDLQGRYDHLRAEAQAAVGQIDLLLNQKKT